MNRLLFHIFPILQENVMIRSVYKITILSLILLTTASAAQAQIREYVGIVRENYYPETISFLEEFRTALLGEGYVSYSRVIDSYLSGGFGSGFVYVSASGDNYIITNRHLISQSQTVSIEFENGDGSSKTYDNLTIVAADEDIDIAILAFPEGQRPFSKGLSFYQGKLKDGDETWSAGFPRLGDAPVWQLSRGNITNGAVRLDSLADLSKTTLIQHSAQVDGGSSGGPLVVPSSAATAGYEVVGMNTWQAVGRSAMNYAIPSATIEAFIEKSIGGTRQNTNNYAEVQTRADEFVAKATSVGTDYTQMRKFISQNYVVQNGRNAFISLLQTAPSSVVSTGAALFSGYSPIEGVRYAIAYSIQKRLEDSPGVVFLTLEDILIGEAGAYNVQFMRQDIPINTIWKKEYGQWYIDQFSMVRPQAVAGTDVQEVRRSMIIKKSYKIGFEFNFAPGLGPKFPFSGGFAVNWNVWDYISIGAGALYSWTTQDGSQGFEITPHIRGQVPLSFWWGTLTPYIKVGTGVAFGTAKFSEVYGMPKNEVFINFAYNAGAGVDFSFGSDHVFTFGIGTQYKGTAGDSPAPAAFMNGPQGFVSVTYGF